MRIPSPFPLHKYQRLVFSDPHRFRVTVNGRRWGKTALGITELVIRGLSYPGKVNAKFPVTVLGVLPTANQARTILWKPLVNICESPEFRPLVQVVNRTSMEVILINGVTIRIVGANDNNGDRLRGLKVYFALLDEVQDIRPAAWFEAIRPAMSDTPGSRALFTGTPKGRRGILWELSQKPDIDPDWSFHTYPTWTNPIIPMAEIETARATMPSRLFMQEYEASFIDFPGKIYSELDADNKYFGELPKLNLVVMGCDFGDLHANLSVLGRGVDQRWYFLESWSPNANPKDAQPVPDPIFHANIRRLVKKWNVKSIYCDPSRPASILAIRSLGDEPGYRNAVAGYNKIWDGISQVHALIAQKNLLFTAGLNDKVKDSLDGQEAYMLHESYHRLQNKLGEFTDEPADGFFSHCVDATRYALSVSKGQPA